MNAAEFGRMFALRLIVDRDGMSRKPGGTDNQGNSGFERYRGNRANGTAFPKRSMSGRGGQKSRLFLASSTFPAPLLAIKMQLAAGSPASKQYRLISL